MYLRGLFVKQYIQYLTIVFNGKDNTMMRQTTSPVISVMLAVADAQAAAAWYKDALGAKKNLESRIGRRHGDRKCAVFPR